MIRLYEKIYRGDNFNEMPVEEYVRLLVTDIVSVFEQQSRGISLRFDIPHLVLPVDIVSPLGLILNELVTNSMKHAFQGRTDGEILIRFVRNAQALTIGTAIMARESQTRTA
jgi:two-component sensor histidine kinase